MVDNNHFLILAVTPENIFEGETHIIESLLDIEFDYVHIRHPNADISSFRELLNSIDKSYHNRLKIHSHFELLYEYDLGGVHLNNRNPEYPGNCAKSKSCHSIEELVDASQYEYVTLSPIFNSISKCGYKSRFDLTELRKNLPAQNVIALGGVTPKHFNELKDIGFGGAMMSGYVFQNHLNQNN